MIDDVIPFLKVHEFFKNADDETLKEVARLGRVAQYPAGSVVHEADDVINTLDFVLHGRLKAVRVGANGMESLIRMIERGEQYGLMAGALDEAMSIRVVALEPSTILRLDYEEALELAFSRPDLWRRWLKTYAGNLSKFILGANPKPSAMMLALIHETPATRPVAAQLIQQLHDIGEQLAVFSDADQRPASPDLRYRSLRENGEDLTPEQIREQVGHWQDANRIIFDVHSFATPERMARLLAHHDRVVYFITPGAAETMRRMRCPNSRTLRSSMRMLTRAIVISKRSSLKGFRR